VYRVITEPSALADIAHHYRYLSDHAHTADYPDAWFEAIVVAILGLHAFLSASALRRRTLSSRRRSGTALRDRTA
jgi:hypothetical protein